VTVVEDSEDLIALYMAPGTRWRRPVRVDDGAVLRYPSQAWRLAEEDWVENRVLHLVRPGDAHAVMPYWHQSDGSFRGWYVNLQEPLRRTPIGFDYMDQMLDIVVGPDLSWYWKDEDELDDEVRLGLITPAEAGAVRQEGERVVELIRERAWPFVPRWERWTPDPAWSIPGFPPGWEAIG
jgi:predicted RNA-binding protein associated with RNAse of E/G family